MGSERARAKRVEGQAVKAVPAFPTPCRMPNGLQWADEGLFVMDQYTDDVLVVDRDGRRLRVVHTLTENGSGVTVGGGYLWTTSNGVTTSRSYRSSDTHKPWILKLDLETGDVVERIPSPDGGGLHGMEWDEGLIWLTLFNPRSLALFDPERRTIVKKFPIDLDVLHGLAREGEGIWCSDRSARLIVSYDISTGAELDRLTLPDDGPDPHGLSIKDGELWYSDAAHPKPSTREHGEVGRVLR